MPTERELAVLEAISRPGGSRRNAARELGITEATVGAHLRRLYRELGVNSAAQAVRVTQRHHLFR